jgi:vacuolar-type H+-ATPase subunit H
MQASDEGKSILTKATKDAEAAIQNGKKLAEKEALDIVAAAQKRHDALLKEAEQKAAEEKRKSLQQAEHEIAKLVVLGVEKAITKQ